MAITSRYLAAMSTCAAVLLAVHSLQPADDARAQTQAEVPAQVPAPAQPPAKDAPVVKDAPVASKPAIVPPMVRRQPPTPKLKARIVAPPTKKAQAKAKPKPKGKAAAKTAKPATKPKDKAATKPATPGKADRSTVGLKPGGTLKCATGLRYDPGQLKCVKATPAKSKP